MEISFKRILVCSFYCEKYSDIDHLVKPVASDSLLFSKENDDDLVVVRLLLVMEGAVVVI